jgi:hypothetical protein
MRLLAIAALLILTSCHSLTEKERMVKDLTGHWLILYPREGMTGSAAHWLYEEIEDSIGGLTGLKLVSFTKDGVFRQQDSIQHEGKWVLSDAGELFISEGGKGFDHFRCVFHGYDKGVLQLKEKISVKGETVTVIWHLKKISKKDEAFSLFEETENKWRVPSQEIESDSEIKSRVVAMLRYYADYYMLVQAHTNYFIPQRVMLPFKFYQRGMGLPKFDTANVFTGFFYSVRQAKLAHRWMDQSMSSLRNSYPSANNYVEGYSKFMTMMADEIKGKEEEKKEDQGIFKK